jgi:hypothetical protein
MAVLTGGIDGVAQSTPPPRIDGATYHSHAEITAYLRQVVAANPRLATLTSIGKSYQGKDLWVITLTNTEKGAPESKPAIFLDGNIDADEPISTEVLLHTIDRLVTGYGRDARVTNLLDTRVFYLAPSVNPDTADLFVTTSTPDVISSRTARPFDEDGDGRLDEDGPEDINGDGLIMQMRVRDMRGGHKTHPADPRLMVTRGMDEPGEWRLYDYEGIDNDGDGQINEDAIGGVDPNRNFPSGWQPDAIQGGAGPYPLSENESMALAAFVIAHPNIGIYLNGHTGGGTGHLYRPYGSKTDREFIPWDLEMYNVLGRRAQELTNCKFYPPSGSAALRRFGREIHGFGYSMEWTYDHHGIVSMVPEHGGIEGDANNDRELTPEERMKVNDEKYGGKLFANWTKVKHPTLGEVEVGGWTKFGLDTNPPAERLPAIVPPWTEWNIYMAEMLPHVSITRADAESIRPGIFRVTAVVTNDGYLPTNVTERSRIVNADWPVTVTLTGGGGAEALLPREITRVGDLQGLGFHQSRATTRSLRYEGVNNARTIEWIVAGPPTGTGWVEIRAGSPRSGTATRRVELRAPARGTGTNAGRHE